MIDIRNVLCPVDFSPASERAIALGAALCERFGGRLTLEHNLDPRPPHYLAVSWMWSEDQQRREEDKALEAQRRLQEIFRRLPPAIACEGRLTRGPIDLALLVAAQRLPADLIVMGSHGPSCAEHRSLTERLVVEAPCPVLTLPEAGDAMRLFAEVRPGEQESAAVVAVDFTAHSLAALAQAFALLERLPLRLYVLHVERLRAAEEDGRRDLARLEEMIPGQLRSRVEVHLEPGRTVEEILAFAAAERACLLIMGTHPKGALSRLFSGMTCREVLHRSPCAVWFVPSSAARLSTVDTAVTEAAEALTA
jgi:nucleotide-binding universal stress UspA family protein